jgi:hypothetical protein
MHAVPLILALLTSACESDHDRWLRGMRAAVAVSWLHELNDEETQFEGKRADTALWRNSAFRALPQDSRQS